MKMAAFIKIFCFIALYAICGVHGGTDEDLFEKRLNETNDGIQEKDRNMPEDELPSQSGHWNTTGDGAVYESGKVNTNKSESKTANRKVSRRSPGLSPNELEIYVKFTRIVFWIRLSLVIGSITFNSLNIVVWKQKEFEKSSTSVLLIGLSVTSLFASLSYIPVIIWEAFDRPLNGMKGFAEFILVMYTLFKAGSSADSWATMALVIERWIAVAMPTKAGIFCTVKRSRTIVISIVIIAIVLNSQTLFRLVITEVWSPVANTTRTVFGYTSFGQDPIVNAIVKWSEAVLNSFIPMIAIIFCNIDMMKKMKQAFATRKNITSTINEEQQRAERSLARILTSIVILSVIYHLTFIISLSVVAINPRVRSLLGWQIFISIGSLFKYFNLSFNFILYNTFSSKFRKALKRILKCNVKNNRANKSGLSQKNQSLSQPTSSTLVSYLQQHQHSGNASVVS